MPNTLSDRFQLMDTLRIKLSAQFLLIDRLRINWSGSSYWQIAWESIDQPIPIDRASGTPDNRFGMLSINWNYPDNWFRVLSIKCNCQDNWFRLSINWNYRDHMYRRPPIKWNCLYNLIRRLPINWNWPGSWRGQHAAIGYYLYNRME